MSVKRRPASAAGGEKLSGAGGGGRDGPPGTTPAPRDRGKPEDSNPYPMLRGENVMKMNGFEFREVTTLGKVAVIIIINGFSSYEIFISIK